MFSNEIVFFLREDLRFIYFYTFSYTLHFRFDLIKEGNMYMYEGVSDMGCGYI